jgi:hypothetical protein
MSKPRTTLVCLFFLSCIGTAKAAPADAPGTVYINGLPCNSACQSYMAWSEEALKGRTAVPTHLVAPQPSRLEVQRATARTARKVTPARASKGPASNQSDGRSVKNAGLARPSRTAEKSVGSDTPANPEPVSRSDADAAKAPEPVAIAPTAQSHAIEVPAMETTGGANPAPPTDSSPPADMAGPAATGPTVQNESPTDLTSETTAALVDAPKADAGAEAGKTAEAVTDNPARDDTKIAMRHDEPNADSSAKPTVSANAASPAESDKAGAASSKADRLVAVLLVRPEIKSVSDLAGKVIAIDASGSVSAGQLKTAIVSGGAAEVKLSEGERMALLRLMDGEVPAAVVTLALPQAAATWTEFPGYNILRIPLRPVSAKAGPG